MSSQLYLFAPENDMALASNKRNYTPTAVVTRFADELSLLPLWYAQGDNPVVLSRHKVDDTMLHRLNLLGVTATVVEQPPHDVTECVPWGWSAYMKQRLLRVGIESGILPDDDTLATLRNLSGRATSRTILQALSQENLGYDIPQLPEVLTTAADVERYVTSQPASMLKSPWSSSGRGVSMVLGKYDQKTARSAIGVIEKQGYIMGEKYHDKVVDFAMEFYSDGQTVNFAGYSLFDTGTRGAYQGSILASNSAIEQQLSLQVGRSHLHSTRDALQRILTHLIAPYYRGYMGVDMIIYMESGTPQLHPCIELNLRMTMGMVARILTDRYLAPQSLGTYMVAYYPHTADLRERYNYLRKEAPLRIKEGKVVSGFLPLTPVQEDTRYIAYMLIR